MCAEMMTSSRKCVLRRQGEHFNPFAARSWTGAGRRRGGRSGAGTGGAVRADGRAAHRPDSLPFVGPPLADQININYNLIQWAIQSTVYYASDLVANIFAFPVLTSNYAANLGWAGYQWASAQASFFGLPPLPPIPGPPPLAATGARGATSVGSRTAASAKSRAPRAAAARAGDTARSAATAKAAGASRAGKSARAAAAGR